MEIFLNYSTWIELLTLTILEVILGIDNLVFIAVLADKLPNNKRDKARIFGLLIALIMRIINLTLISWIMTLTQPIFKIFNLIFSGRSIILITGGVFLIFKAIIELHERLEHQNTDNNNRNYVNFWGLVIQIVILDMVFSLDAVITAIGMVNNLLIMMISVVLAMLIMLFSSKMLAKFINHHPTVIVLCLSFLLILGITLVSEGLGYHIPKGYLYTSISFSILIEILNQIGKRNFIKYYQSNKPIRERAAEAILKLFGRKYHYFINNKKSNITILEKKEFKDEEKCMINEILNLATHSIKDIMIPRKQISWINIDQSIIKIKNQVLKSPYSLFPLCQGKLDNIIGVVTAKEILCSLNKKNDILQSAYCNKPIFILDTIDTINLLKILSKSKIKLLLVISKKKSKKSIQGLITPIDFLETITGELIKKNKLKQ